MASPKSGSDIDSYCNKCKLVLAHVIIAMDGSRVARVECKTCRSVHAYKAKPGERATRSGTKSASGTKTTTTRKASGSRASKAGLTQADYDKVIHGKDLSRAQRYRATINFVEGDVVDHINFGVGMVTRLLADCKMEVLFPTGIKVLVHSR
jgi:hypothetical protein